MKKLITVLLLIFSHIFFAQESKESNWVLKLNTTQLIDFFSYPTVMVSAERKINPYFSINAELGYQYIFSKPDTTIVKSKGFKTNLEGRMYLFKLLHARKESRRSELYIGLQFFYRKNQATSYIEYYDLNDKTLSYDEYIGVKKSAKGFNITLGNQISVSKKFILEPYVGLGMLNRKIKNTNIEYDQTKHEISGTDLVPLFRILNLEESSGNVFNFCFGFRVGYRL